MVGDTGISRNVCTGGAGGGYRLPLIVNSMLGLKQASAKMAFACIAAESEVLKQACASFGDCLHGPRRQNHRARKGRRRQS